MIASLMSISLLMLVSYCFLLPEAMTGYHILWLMWIIIPLLILSFFFSPHEPDTMTMMPSTFFNFAPLEFHFATLRSVTNKRTDNFFLLGKNMSPLRDLPRFIFYFLARFILPIAMCVFVFL